MQPFQAIPSATQNICNSLITLSVLAVLIGLAGSGCSSPKLNAIAVQPAAESPVADSLIEENLAEIKKNDSLVPLKQYKVSADSNGDFRSALLIGHRGVYGNNRWLVMPQVDEYLNCRYTPNGEIRSEIVPSMIITAKFGGPLSTDNRQTPNPAADAIVLYEGKPWLRVTGTDRASFFPPSANRSSQDYIGECYVRANSQYITNVNNDAAN